MRVPAGRFDASGDDRDAGGADIIVLPVGPLTDTGVTLRSVLARGEPGRTRVDVIEIPGGASLPRHRAGADQKLYVVAGRGRVAGSDDVPFPVGAGQAVSWARGEIHTTWADETMTVLVVQTTDGDS